MKILYIVNISSFFESHFLRLALESKSMGYDVHLVVGDNDKKEYFKSLGIHYHKVSLSRDSTNFFSEINSILEIRKKIINIDPDIIHCFTIKPIIYTGISNFLRISKRSLKVYSVTGLGSMSLSNTKKGKILWNIILFLYKLTFSQKNTIGVFENEDDKKLFTRKNIINVDNAVLVNGAGIDTNKYFPTYKNNTPLKIVLVARMLKDKGVREFIQSSQLLHENKVNVRMILVGGIDESNISSLSLKEINKAVTDGYVEYLGHQSDILSIYQSSDVACLPSYREGLPKSLIEAASCGLPIITTNVPGCRQMIDDGLNGILVKAKDSISLAKAIEDLVNDENKLKSMGEYSRKMAVEKFDYKHVLSSFMKIYKREVK
ncbi:glycosyltransferase family 4 protein [Photobacterium leiognathi]|uniref:glycosyltransferase family 4 protein n=1 Tax=Photobacterium leiognathi TaxID=553611 RepID=UPI0029814625|nr:glycosyltransferase family 4 protein [Photobacterium leiognathi]